MTGDVGNDYLRSYAALSVVAVSIVARVVIELAIKLRSSATLLFYRLLLFIARLSALLDCRQLGRVLLSRTDPAA